MKNQLMRSVYIVGLLASLISPVVSAQTNASFVRIDDGRVSIDVRQVPIHDVLVAMRDQVAIDFVIYDSLDEAVTVTFTDLSLPDALGEVLQHRNYAIEFRAGSGSPRQNGGESINPAVRVWVYSMSGGDGRTSIANDRHIPSRQISKSPSVAGKTTQRLADLEADLFDHNPLTREQALDALGERQGQSVVPLLMNALNDSETDVRAAAVDALIEIGTQDAVHALEVALHDADPDLRAAAHEALQEIGVRAYGLPE